MGLEIKIEMVQPKEKQTLSIQSKPTRIRVTQNANDTAHVSPFFHVMERVVRQTPDTSR